MGRIKYRKGDMLAAPPKGAFLLHACNPQGSWGPFIAEQFKAKWPKAYLDYKAVCDAHTPDELAGTNSIVTEDEDHPIICMFTSMGHGRTVSKPRHILVFTEEALLGLEEMFKGRSVEIHSPKINSGKFKVDWDLTSRMVEAFLERNHHVRWVVWEL